MMKNLFVSVFEISVSSSLVIAVLLVLGPLLNRRYVSKWKYYIWIVIAFRLVVPFNIKSPLRQIVIDIPEIITAPVAADTGAAIPIAPQLQAEFTEVALLDLLAAIWLLAGVFFLSVHILSCLHYKARIIRNGTYVKNRLILRLLFRLRKELHIKAGIDVMKYSGAESPMVIGFFRPVLVLPDIEYSSEELFYILKHELIHFKRRDIYFKFLFIAANAVHWFNPLVYFMRKEACFDMELSCDERVIRGTAYAARKAYTQTLLSTVQKQCKKAAFLTTQFYGGKEIMKKRFENILMKSKKKNGIFVLIGTACITLITGMSAGCSIIDHKPSEIQTPTHTQESEEPVTEEVSEMASGQALTADEQEIKSIVENFAAAYFGGDMAAMQGYLTVPYEWEADVYTGAGSLSDFTLKGLTDMGVKEIGSTHTVSLEFKDSDYDDMFLYLTMEFIKEEEGWRIQFYGLEG